MNGYRFEYRRHEQPGCGGCLLLLLLAAFLFGGGPLLFEFLGFLIFGGLFLIFAAIAAFWAFTYYVKRQISTYERSQTETHNTFVYLLVNILVKIARIDGRVTKEEIHTIHRFFQHNLHYTQSRLYWVKDLVKEALQSEVSLESLLADFKSRFAYEPRLILLELIYQVLYANERVTEAELQVARNIGEFLAISAYERQAIEARYRYGGGAAGPAPARMDENRYYEILGLAPGADFATIKAAYRKLSMQYHPDKVGHLGEEFKQVAEEKMKDINAAYDHLKKKFRT